MTEKKLFLLFMFIGYRLHEYDFRTDILCNLFDLEFPEMGCLNLDLSPGHRNDAVLGRFDSFTNFLALTHIDLRDFSSTQLLNPAVHEPYAAALNGSGISTGLHGLIPLDGKMHLY